MQRIGIGVEIEPRPASLSGGWHLRLLEDDGTEKIEVGGGLFPVENNISSDESDAG